MPSFVDARVVGAPTMNSEPRATKPDLFYLAVPPGDYSGFAGGPVGVYDAHGTIRVVGIILNPSGQAAGPTKTERILTAQAIPASPRARD